MAKENKLIISGQADLVTKSTAGALFVLIEGGLPKQQAMIKLGIHKPLATQLDKLATTYIDYYVQGEDVYNEKIARNTPKMQKYIESCIEVFIACEQAEAEFGNTLVGSVMAGVPESPELALKVLERRFADDWSPKKQIDIKKEVNTLIKTIEINMPGDTEPVDADFEVVTDD